MRLYERSLTGAGKPGCSTKEAPWISCVQTAPKAPPWANPSAACAALSPIIQPHLVDEVVVVVAVAIVAQLHSMLALMLPLALRGNASHHKRSRCFVLGVCCRALTVFCTFAGACRVCV